MLFLLHKGPPLTTAPPPPPMIPEAPKFLSTDPTTTSVSVTWQSPPDNSVRITGYRMTYGPSYNRSAKAIDLAPSPTQTQLTGLEDNTQYQISLIAYNADGDSEPVTVTFVTLEGKNNFIV